MKPIYIQFNKLEFGTLFFDPTTKVLYRKVSETKAEPEENELVYYRIDFNIPVNDVFHPNEIVIVN